MTPNYREKLLIENGWKVVGGLNETPNNGICVRIESPNSILIAWMHYDTGHIYWFDGENESWDQFSTRFLKRD